MSDLHLGPDRPTEAEREAVDAVVEAGPGPALVHHDRLVIGGARRRDARRHLLLPALHALQHTSGWISPGGANHVADQLQIPPAEVHGVASFYDLFRVDPPEHDGDVVHVCVDAACQVAGAAAVLAELEAAGTPAHPSPCLGQCERPVARFVQVRSIRGRGDQGRSGQVSGAADRQADHVPVDVGPDGPPPPPVPQLGDPSLRLLRRVGRVDPGDLQSYVGAGGYRALGRAFTLGPAGVIDEVERSGLRGRGGAAFPAGLKWRAVAGEPGPRHLVVNADESEPGTFKDRVVMEHDPFAVVEAATIAGFAVGAERGWIYVRGEYPLATERLRSAVAQARDAGFLGQRIARSSFSFDIEIRRGAGAYICGEETALFRSLEGHRGEPRQKPPYPTTHGLFGQPTAVNNPETLINVLDIVIDGGGPYADIGTGPSTGTKLFCLSGHVAAPGLYEVPFGATLGELLDRAGGSVGQLRAVLLGGAAGHFVGPDRLDLPLTFEATGEVGLSLGSGVVMAFADGTDFTAVVRRLAEFFRHESCGQCVPCRVGTVRQVELLARPTVPGTGRLLDDVARVMADASICGLGHTAASAVRSAVELGLVEVER